MITIPRDTYRHGDLRRALLDAAIALARGGGPDAVVLREATRRAGVVPNAAYRHFPSRDALLRAVRAAAFAALAAAAETALADLPADADPRAQLRALGMAYLRFAWRETGLFRTAFAVPTDPTADATRETAGPGGLDPFELLGTVLDRLATAGFLPSARRPGAEYLAWSAVHGLALLVLDGPLQGRDEAERTTIAQAVLDMVEAGLAATT